MRFKNYSIPQITEKDITAVAEVLRKNEWLAGNGPVTRQFEKEIAEYTGYEFAIAVNSATSGLFVASSVLFKRSYCMSIPALTFIATANMMIAVNREIGIEDILIESFVDPRASVPVSFAGYPVVNGTMADDAHYLVRDMASWKNHDASVISLHAVKHITSGEGGVILTNDKRLYQEMSKLVDQGRGAGNTEFGFGYNFRLPDMNAALALSQLRRHPEILAHKRRLAHEYYRLLEGSALTLPPYHEKHAWHLYVVLVSEPLTGRNRADRTVGSIAYRNEVAKRLAERGIATGHHYPPLYTYPHLAQYKAEECPVTEMVWSRGISLPLYPDMTLEDVAYVSESLLEILDE